MCILGLSKVLSCKFHYDYIKNKYGNNSRFLFTDTDSFCNKFKVEDVYEDFSKDKEMFDFSSCSAESTSYDSNKLVVGNMKDETGGVTIKEFAGSKSKMYFLAGDNSKHKKAKGVNENVVATISHGEYTDILLNKKCLTHSINRIQNKDHRIKT